MHTFRSAIFLTICLNISAQAEIHEIDSLAQILDYVGTGKTELIIFDIDDTLIRGLKREATHQWFCDQMQELIATGLTAQQAADAILPIYTAAQCVTEVQLIDEQAPTVLQELSDRGVLRLELTARGRAPMVDATFRQFADMGISCVQENEKWEQVFTFAPLPGETLYKNGVLFCDGPRNKSPALEIFFTRMNYLPEHIVFIDDELGNIQVLEQLAEKLHIRFDGFHFLRVKHGLVKSVQTQAVL